jgi:tetratricopeptide (TPR) repeat protein
MTGGCVHLNRSSNGIPLGPDYLKNAETFFYRGDYAGALKAYKKVMTEMPQNADQALFYTGVIYGSPQYAHRDYPRAIANFQKLAIDFPQSPYGAEAERLTLLLQEVLNKEREGVNKDQQIKALKKEVESLEIQINRMKEIDLNVESKRRKSLKIE